MACAVTNYKTGKAFKDAVKLGPVAVYQPGPFGPAVKDGPTVIEGPHYSEAHRWYVSVIVKDGVVVRVAK